MKNITEVNTTIVNLVSKLDIDTISMITPTVMVDSDIIISEQPKASEKLPPS